MQKPLNTSAFALYSLWQRMLLLNRKAGLLAGLTLLFLTGLASPALAGSGFYKDFVVLNGNYYYTNDPGNSGYPSFQAINGNGNIGTYDRGTGSLRLGGEANTYNDGGDDIQSAQLYYRVYPINTTPGSFTELGLDFQFKEGNNKRWSNNKANPNLILSTSSEGRYVLEVFFRARGTYTNSGGTGDFTIFDNNSGGSNYKVTFDVTGTVPVQWTGGANNNNWFTKENWNPQVVPTRTTDATIPYATNAPFITSGQVAQVRTLTVLGNNDALGARTFFLREGAELQVFGNFNNPNNAFDQSGGLFTLAGQAQEFDAATFTDIQIQGGGTKILRTRMDVLSTLTFSQDKVLGGGIIKTGTDNANLTSVDLRVNARVVGESESSYVEGYLRSLSRQVNQNQTNDFGSIGIDLTATAADAGIVSATRLTGIANNGIGTSKSIERSFTFSADNPPSNLNFNLTFHYLDGELVNNQNVRYIDESNLVLFRSFSGNVPYANLGKKTADPSANTLTQEFIQGTLLATFTLGDRLNPLPVTVTSFTAVAQGADAVLDWATATEKNSQGFEVQVSTDAKTYRKLGFVASAANSSAPRSYQYRDATAGKTGTRYYRLRQLDLDGKEAFIGPKAVAFGAPTVASVQGYPNPFGAEINLELQAIAGGPATVSLLDGLGRQVRSWQPTLAVGTSSLSLPGLQSLARGLYVVQVRYSDGQTQRLKLVKE